MAYVGTPSYLGNDVTTLAGILQGESATAEGQQAVASVMANRLNSGGFVTNNSYGGILGIALGQNQFQGQVTNPNSQSIAIAQQALNGSLTDNTGGALYYGAPAPGNASWLNNLLASGTGTKIGGNTFSDQMGPASAAFQAGNGGVAGSNIDGAIDPEYDYLDAASPGAQNMIASQDAAFSSGGGSASSGDPFSLFGSPSTPSGAGVGYNATSAGSSGLGSGSSLFGADSTSDLNSSLTAGLPSDPATAVGSVNASTLASSLGGAGGINVNLTDETQLAPNVAAAGKSVQAGATTAGSDVQTAAGGIAGTAASIFNNFQSYASGALVITALVVMGLVFVAFGLGMFKHSFLPQAA